jgi:hypothetical protein
MRYAQIMSHEFEGLDATEKAGIEGALNRCRRLAAQIESELRNKRPERGPRSMSANSETAARKREERPASGAILLDPRLAWQVDWRRAGAGTPWQWLGMRLAGCSLA